MAPPKGALKGRKRPEGAGRKKGTLNKLTVEAKEAFRLAAEGMGGVPALTAWGASAPDKFWPLYARLIPLEVTGKDGSPLVPSTIRIELVDPNE